jgi:hypothetical protein
MPPFQKGHPKYGGRQKGRPLVMQREIREWVRELFEDPLYRESVRRRLFKGRLPPQVECKLLAYAYGEPPRDITLNANVRGLVSVVHEHFAAAVREVEAPVEAEALPSTHCITMHETVVRPPSMQLPERRNTGTDSNERT